METKKKILYVITKSNFGGAQRYVYDLATSLSKEQFEVAVILGGEGLLKENLNSKGIRVIALPYFGRDILVWNDIKTFFSLFTILRKEQPDVVHLNSSKAGGIGALATRLYNLSKVKGQRSKVIFTAHGWAFNEIRPLWQKIIIYFFSWLTILLSHTTIAVSQKTKKQISFLPFISKKIVHIQNGIATAFPKNTKEEARAALISKRVLPPPHPDARWIGSVAELHTIKGLRYAIEAIGMLVKENYNIRYIIIGEGEERKNLEYLIKKEKLEPYVFLAGALYPATSYLSAFDVLLMPSVSEALPYTLLEAGRAELPVVASAVGGIPEIIAHKKTGMLVPPKDSRAIADATRELLEKPGTSAQYGKALSEKLKEEFSLAEAVKKTTRLYV